MAGSSVEADFRKAMRRFAATVTILTVAVDERPMGMIATAVCSLSFEPPSILACVNRTAYLHPIFGKASKFGVNVLAVEQEAVIAQFFDPELRDRRFEGFPWHLHEAGVPVIEGSQASLVCAITERMEHTSHTVLIGEVIDVSVREEISPLIYVDGALAQHAAGVFMSSTPAS